MKEKNGNGAWMKIVIMLGLAALAAMGTYSAFQAGTEKDVAHLHEEVQSIKPEVELNKEHRYRFEEKVIVIEKGVKAIQTTQTQMMKKIDELKK